MKMHLKKYRRKSKIINKIIIIILLVIISIIYILKLFNTKALPHLQEYAEIETTKIVSNLINNSVNQSLTNKINLNDLFITTKSDNEIKSIDFNSSSVNNLLIQISKNVEDNLKYLEKGEVDKIDLDNLEISDKKLKKGIIYELPSGLIFNNVILNNTMPKIPIKISTIGSVYTKIITNVEGYGINNALIKVSVSIEANVKILFPFSSFNKKIIGEVPLIMKVIEGSVPSYYLGGYLNTPTNK